MTLSNEEEKKEKHNFLRTIINPSSYMFTAPNTSDLIFYNGDCGLFFFQMERASKTNRAKQKLPLFSNYNQRCHKQNYVKEEC